MKANRGLILALLLSSLATAGAQAAVVTLEDWGFNIDGTTYCSLGPCDNQGIGPGGLPGSVNTAGFDFNSGLGSITATINGAGAHSVVGFFDLSIDEADNTWFNEQGAAVGAAAAGQSWEIDEPQLFPDNSPFGDIWTHFLTNALDNAVFNPSGVLSEDVSMAMAWDFVLAAGEVGVINFLVSESVPASGFYLEQYDPHSDASVYLTSSLRIDDGGPGPVFEPGTVGLLGFGLLALAAARRRRAV